MSQLSKNIHAVIKLMLSFSLVLSTALFGQSMISTINVGGFSNNSIIYSVGDIFVNPVVNPNDANSGLIGTLSRIEFFVTGLTEEIVSEDLKIYPNPTKDLIYFISLDTNIFNWIYIHDATGKLVFKTMNLNNPIDLTNLPNATYLISTDNPNIKPFKIIKQQP